MTLKIVGVTQKKELIHRIPMQQILIVFGNFLSLGITQLLNMAQYFFGKHIVYQNQSKRFVSETQ